MEQLIEKQVFKRLPFKDQHPYHMYDMISDTPQSLERILQQEITNIKSIASKLYQMKKILLIGIGTSYNACLNARYYLRTIAKIDAEAFNSFEFILDSPLSLYPVESTAVLIFSHRGVKTYSYKAYTSTRELGLYSVLFTSLDSIIEEKIDIIRTSKGEQSSAFTVSHSSSTLCSLLLANEIAKLKKLTDTVISDDHLQAIPSNLSKIFNDKQDQIKAWCKYVCSGTNPSQLLYFLSYGASESNAPEVALKINEATWAYSIGYELEQYIHGPWVATDPNTCSTFIVGSNSIKYQDAIDRTAQGIGACINVGGKVAAIIPESHTLLETVVGVNGVVITTPDVIEPISTLTNLFTLQLLTYWLSIEKKTNPDTFKKDQPKYDNAFTKAGLIL